MSRGVAPAEQCGVGYALRAKNGWKNGGNGTDALGFGALPAGYRFLDGAFHRVLESAYFFCATEYDGASYARDLYYADSRLYVSVYDKDAALSVRCVKDS